VKGLDPVIAALLLVCHSLLAAPTLPPSPTPAIAPTPAAAGAQTARFAHADSAIRIDGKLDEGAWHSAPPLTQFFEIYPADIAIPTVKTEARFLYDDQNIYIGIRAFDPNPKAIRSALVRRDQVLADQDYVEILLDPVDGRRNALMFRTNARGVPTDAQFSEETQYRDYTADFDFDVASSADAEGWTAEFKIPLSTLRYHLGSTQTWAFAILRNWPRTKTVTLSSAPVPRKANCTLCVAGELTDITLGKNGDALTITPYMAINRTSSNNSTTQSASVSGRAGFDAKWQPRPDIAMDLTVKPDFSQVEADDLQLTTNTKFALSVTEKRPFFLEGSDLLTNSNGINAIYTRAFSDPEGGIRITRRGSDYEYAALLLKDAGGGSVVEPGPIRSQLGAQDFTSTALVGRYKFNDDHVTWGALTTFRLNSDGSENFVAGVDSTWLPSSSDRISAQVLGSQTRNPNRPDLLSSWTGQRIDGDAEALTWTHSSNRWFSDVELYRYSPGFRAWNGFVPQTGVSYVLADAGLNFYPRHSFLVRVSPLLLTYHIHEVGGSDLGKYTAPGLILEGPGNTSLTIYWYPRLEDITLVGLRTYSQVYFNLKSAPAAWLSQLMVTALVGEGLDVTTGEVGKGLNVQATVPIHLLNALELRPTIAYQSLDSGQTAATRRRLFSELDVQTDLIWHFSSQLYFEALLQRSKNTNGPPRGPPSAGSRSTNTLSSLLLSYQANWQTRYYLGFRRGINQADELMPMESSRNELFLKLTHALSVR
jgi:hypothetical protein